MTPSVSAKRMCKLITHMLRSPTDTSLMCQQILTVLQNPVSIPTMSHDEVWLMVNQLEGSFITYPRFMDALNILRECEIIKEASPGTFVLAD